MAVPAETTVYIVTCRVGESSNDIFHCACQQMSVVRQACGERWSIVERKRFATLGLLQRRLEGVNGLPIRKHLFLLLREVECARCIVFREHRVRVRHCRQREKDSSWNAIFEELHVCMTRRVRGSFVIRVSLSVLIYLLGQLQDAEYLSLIFVSQDLYCWTTFCVAFNTP